MVFSNDRNGLDNIGAASRNERETPVAEPARPVLSELGYVVSVYRTVFVVAAIFLATWALHRFAWISSETAFVIATVAALIIVALDNFNQASIDGFTNQKALSVATPQSAHTTSNARLVDAIPDPALILDRGFIILEHNGAARDLFGKRLNGLALEHVTRDPELISSVAEAWSGGSRRSVRLAWQGRVERHLMATIAPVGEATAPDGIGTAAVVQNPDCILITIRDLSEQHRLVEMRTDFIANASHELRTPLASVRGFIETLQGPARDDAAARERFLGIMAAQAERMTRLIDDLLMLSRVEEKAYLPPTGRIDLDAVISDVVRTLLPIADERRITITVLNSNGSGDVVGEHDELFQVFQNLIENAVKYGRDGGSVTISRSVGTASNPQDLGKTTITISDDGPGIAPEHLPRLTERFYRVNADQSRKIGGTGLGLAIVKHVLNRHQGQLQFSSEVGRGTTVRVTMRLAKLV